MIELCYENKAITIQKIKNEQGFPKVGICDFYITTNCTLYILMFVYDHVNF